MPVGARDAGSRATLPPPALPRLGCARGAARAHRGGLPCARGAARGGSPGWHTLPAARARPAPLRVRGRARRTDDADAGVEIAVQESRRMSQHATGAFDVKVVPQKPDTQIARAANLSRLTIDKRFHGDLEGISKGEMLAIQSDVKGSAGYVALERVTGKLK